jgi:cytochrome oxidase Cu insertion factor (SCO1/SenC/PrrC family)
MRLLIILILQTITVFSLRAIDHQSKNNKENNQEEFDFQLPDRYGNLIKLSDFRGKVVFIDFWFTGCAGCKLFYANVLRDVKKLFLSNGEVVFMSISIDADKDKWIESLESEEYTDGSAINLYTSGLGSKHTLIKEMEIKSYPSLFVIDRNGNIFNNNPNRELRRDNKLIETLNNALSK